MPIRSWPCAALVIAASVAMLAAILPWPLGPTAPLVPSPIRGLTLVPATRTRPLAYPASTVARWSVNERRPDSLEGVTQLDDLTRRAAWPLRFGPTPPALTTDAAGRVCLAFDASTDPIATGISAGGDRFFDAATVDPTESVSLLFLVDFDPRSLTDTPLGGADRLIGTPNAACVIRALYDPANDDADLRHQQLNRSPGVVAIATALDSEPGWPKLLEYTYLPRTEGGTTHLRIYDAFPTRGRGNAKACYESITTGVTAGGTSWQGRDLLVNIQRAPGFRFYAGAVLHTRDADLPQRDILDAKAMLVNDAWKGTTDAVLIVAGDSLSNPDLIRTNRVPNYDAQLEAAWNATEPRVRVVNCGQPGARISSGAGGLFEPDPVPPSIGAYDETEGIIKLGGFVELLTHARLDVVVYQMFGTNDIGGDDLPPHQVAAANRRLAAWLNQRAGANNRHLTMVWGGTCFDWQGDDATVGRGLVHELIKASPGHFDATLDTFTDSPLWYYGNNYDGTEPWMDDGTHPSTLGNEDIGILLDAALSPIVF